MPCKPGLFAGPRARAYGHAMEWRTPAEPESLPREGFTRRDHEAAIAASEADPEFRDWARLAEHYLALDRKGDAMRACERGLQDGPTAALHHARGLTFAALGLRAQALAEFRRAVTLGEWPLMAMRAAMRMMAADEDAAPLLAYCDTVTPALRETAVTRAFRAIALSKLGRHAEARALVDLERHVMRIRFDPRDGREAFNRALSAEILADPPAGREGARVSINYRPRLDEPAMAALQAFTRQAMQDYMARREAMGLADILPLPRNPVILQTATTVLRRDGRNRQHIHPRGLISSVYHAQVPEPLRDARDHRGALVLGVCDEPAGGHQGCWGTRHIPAAEGWLTIFPAHVFHDVVPSGIEAPRISIASDLCPR